MPDRGQDPKDDSIVLLVVVLHLLVLDPPENRVQRQFRRALSAVAALQASGEAGGTQYALKLSEVNSPLPGSALERDGVSWMGKRGENSR